MSLSKMIRLLKIISATTIVLLCGCYVRQDQLDAERAAERIHLQITNQDFQSIYSESGDSFKKAGDESKFVAGMRQIQDAAGTLKKATPIAYQFGFDSNVGGVKHVLLFDLDFERGRGKERMILTRAKNGQMQLWDLAIDPMD